MHKNPLGAPETIPGSVSETLEYWSSLGNFIDAFASVETALQITLWHYAKVPEKMARALLSGATRVDTASGLLRRVIEVRKLRRIVRTDLIEVLDQLGAIAKVRNDLVHLGTMTTPKARMTTNAYLAVDRKRLRKTPISPRILNDMTLDLLKIGVHLTVRHFRRGRIRKLGDVQKTLLDAAWQYKRPSQQKSEREKGAIRQHHKPRPKPPGQP